MPKAPPIDRRGPSRLRQERPASGPDPGEALRWGRGVAEALLIAALLVAGCDSADRDGPASETGAGASPPVVEEATFVGSARCATCHPSETTAWQGSHHDRAMESPSETSIEGRFDGRTLEVHGTTWRFFREGDAWRVGEAKAGQAESRLEVVASFGVAPLQQVLVERPNGRRQVLPVAWGRIGEAAPDWFALDAETPAPTGDPLHWDGLAFRWNVQCASCHSTALRKGFDDATGYYATTYAEEDVACEACHGPGSLHVRGAEAEADDVPSLPVSFDAWRPDAWQRDEGAAIARRVAPRAHDVELDVCGPCHARRGELVPAPEIGAPLLDGYAPRLLAPDLYFDDGGIRDEVYVWGSFLQSRMYAAGVRCSDCHDPHSGGLRREGEALCVGCHAPDRYTGDAHFGHGAPHATADCVDCHMPERTYMRIDARRDHAFAIPRPRRHEALGSTSACATCHPAQSADEARRAIDRWRGDRPIAEHWSDALHRGSEARADAERWLEVARSPRATPFVVASAWSRYAQESAVAPPADLLRDLASRSDLERFGAIDLIRRRPLHEQTRALVERLDDERRAIRVAAAEALSALPQDGLPPAMRSALARGLREYRAVQQANADRPEAQVNLGTLALRVGDVEGARAAYEKALDQAPYFVPAHVNLADVARAEGDERGAIGHLEQALRLDPDNPLARYALGLARHRTGDAAGAVEELGRAAAAAPHDPRLVLGHALALSGVGRGGEARRILEAAIERGADDPAVHHARVALVRDEEGAVAARRAVEDFLTRFPEDPRALAVAREYGLRR